MRTYPSNIRLTTTLVFGLLLVSVGSQGRAQDASGQAASPTAHRGYFEKLPADSYVPFRADLYSACLECHDKQMVLDEFDVKTRFRNGTKNLHFLHTNNQKGRNCTCCHTLDRDGKLAFTSEIPSGKNWKLSLKVTIMAGGGRCVVGCHKPKDYDRENPVTY